MRVGWLFVAVGLTIGACSTSARTESVPSSSDHPTVPAGVARPSTEAASASASNAGTDRPAVSAGTFSGSIMFMHQDAGQHWRIWIACEDLTRARLVSTKPGFDAGWSVFSPDGSRIAFNANFADADPSAGPDIWDVYSMDRDGMDVRRLTHSTGLEGDPGYSPDGALIAYDSTEPGRHGIWVMDAADGGHPRLVTPDPAPGGVSYGPRFSPDGRRLLFTFSIGDFTPGAFDGSAWVVNVDGTDLRRITPASIYPSKAEWSPDGTWIATDAASDAYPFQTLWLVRPDGADVHRIEMPPTVTGDRDGFADVAWSPDGSMILADHGVFDGGTRSTVGLATIGMDGSGLSYLGDGSGDEHKPDWSEAGC